MSHRSHKVSTTTCYRAQNNGQPVVNLYVLSPVLYYKKIKRWQFTSSFSYSILSLSFSTIKNARNSVQGNQSFLKFSRTPRRLHFYSPHAPPPPRQILATCLLTLRYYALWSNIQIFRVTRLGTKDVSYILPVRTDILLSKIKQYSHGIVFLFVCRNQLGLKTGSPIL